MPKETIANFLRRRLAEAHGLHNTIAKESGVAQATVSRIHLGQCSPTLDTAQPLLDWFAREDRKTAKRGRKRAEPRKHQTAEATA